MELASIHSRNLIEMLMRVNALSNMALGAGTESHNAKHHLETAARWLPKIESELSALKRELSRENG